MLGRNLNLLKIKDLFEFGGTQCRLDQTIIFNQILILSIGLAVTGMHILGTLFQIKFLKIDKTYIGLSDKFYMTRPLVVPIIAPGH